MSLFAATFAGTSVRKGVHPFVVLLLASLWLATVCNIPLWMALAKLPELSNPRGLLFGLTFGLMIAAANLALLSLFAWRWTLKLVLTVFFLAAATGSHFMWSYGVVIDPTMMVNVLHTDLRESRDLLSWRMAASIALLGLLPTWWLWRTPLQTTGWLRTLGRNTALFVGALFLLVAVLALSYRDMSSVMRNHTEMRYRINPLNSFWALGSVATAPLRRDNSTLLAIGLDAHLPAASATARPPMLVLVVGETARSANFGLNGYARNTTPKLAQQNVVSWRNAWSCGTNTATSVPCMFSHLGREAYADRNANYENLLDVLQRAGLAVLWVDNQSGCKGVCDRVPQVNTAKLSVAGLCDSGECHDMVMLEQLDQRIAQLPAQQRARGVVVVMHQMGSHGPAYYKRTPATFKPFLPECASNALQECSRETLVNAYDNTIAYTDHFLASTINWLQSRSKDAATALMYVSDHGESLGESNLYLHGLPWQIAPDVQKHIPWITWLSPQWQTAFGVHTDCLRGHADQALSHDHYFHSVLGMLKVQSKIYRNDLDIFTPCQQAVGNNPQYEGLK